MNIAKNKVFPQHAFSEFVAHSIHAFRENGNIAFLNFTLNKYQYIYICKSDENMI